MPRKRVSTSASVTLTRDELVSLHGVQQLAWGASSKAALKLAAAIERIDKRNQA